MFGFFKKREKEVDVRALGRDVMARAAKMLEVQLTLHVHAPNFEDLVDSEYVRGYFFGFFDAAIQYANLPADNDLEFMGLMAAGHAGLMSGDTKEATYFLLDTVKLKENETFRVARRKAGDEYFASLNGKLRMPMGLMNYLHENTGSARSPRGERPQRSALDSAREVSAKLIISGYRGLAQRNRCAPTSKTSDDKIIEIYAAICTAFSKASQQKGELIPAVYLNFIAFKFMQIFEMNDETFFFEHLQYEIDKYLSEGLRPDYQQELKLF